MTRKSQIQGSSQVPPLKLPKVCQNALQKAGKGPAEHFSMSYSRGHTQWAEEDTGQSLELGRLQA